MAIDYDQVMGLEEVKRIRYTAHDTILYALSTGFGTAGNAAELPFVYEGAGLVASPTLMCALSGGIGIVHRSGIDYSRMVHAGQYTNLFTPLPVEGECVSVSRVKALIDKGINRGAIIVIETTISKLDGMVLATIVSSGFCRGDGGVGDPGGEAPPEHPMPARAPDDVFETQTRADQALLYRLMGDLNPLHVDPEFAREVGFERPILHGLCTYGMIAKEMLCRYCDFDAIALKGIDARFSHPVYPGETLITEVWREGSACSFRTRVKERDVLVLDQGQARFARMITPVS